MAVFGFVKFQVCLKSVNISFEPEFGNPRFETPKKSECFQFSVNLFLHSFQNSGSNPPDFENPKLIPPKFLDKYTYLTIFQSKD